MTASDKSYLATPTFLLTLADHVRGDLSLLYAFDAALGIPAADVHHCAVSRRGGVGRFVCFSGFGRSG